MTFCVFVPFQRSSANSPVEGGIAGVHVVPEHFIKLCQRGNGSDIKCVEPAFLQGSEVPFYFALAGTITDLCM